MYTDILVDIIKLKSLKEEVVKEYEFGKFIFILDLITKKYYKLYITFDEYVINEFKIKVECIDNINTENLNKKLSLIDFNTPYIMEAIKYEINNIIKRKFVYDIG